MAKSGGRAVGAPLQSHPQSSTPQPPFNPALPEDQQKDLPAQDQAQGHLCASSTTNLTVQGLLCTVSALCTFPKYFYSSPHGY